jgi:hypothetical protein
MAQGQLNVLANKVSIYCKKFNKFTGLSLIRVKKHEFKVRLIEYFELILE